MTTVRETVLAAFKTQLETALTGTATVARNQKDAVTSPPAVVMEDGGQTRDDSNSAEDRYQMRVRVWAYVAAEDGEDGAAVGGAISTLHAAIVQAVTQDPSLGGSAEYVTEADMDDPDWDQDPGTRDNAAFAVNFTVEFVTKTGDPTQTP